MECTACTDGIRVLKIFLENNSASYNIKGTDDTVGHNP